MYPGWSARDNYAVHKKKRKRKLKQVDSKGDDSQEEGHKEGRVEIVREGERRRLRERGERRVRERGEERRGRERRRLRER